MTTLNNTVATMKVDGRKAIFQAVQTYLEAHPEIEAIQWSQYTPSFNDGDPCTFRTGDMFYKVKGEDDYHYGYDSSVDGLESDVERFFGLKDDEILYFLFGNNVTVTINREKLSVEEGYDCGY